MEPLVNHLMSTATQPNHQRATIQLPEGLLTKHRLGLVSVQRFKTHNLMRKCEETRVEFRGPKGELLHRIRGELADNWWQDSGKDWGVPALDELSDF